ncbi:hypothetical protein [Candidatus Bodocaedibacter vickermanii]|uniref:Uncharacterized protein n=1 Tax=Candidatus Bodocaedibacter vickermanii TaxID=2741701 RepID=A0A7L9RSR5_9PROT|nr:hypothetical protein CPBP_00356 [Candidatus Paracaedibacteraceae bacterium 'Lake Konstanz']
MNHNSLKEIISWIATHGINAYSAKTIERDLNIQIDESFHSAHSVISKVLMDALNAAQITTNIKSPASTDDFFDLMLTFLENLSDYKADFQTLFNQKNLSFENFNLVPVVNELTQTLLNSKIETFLDKITHTLIICNILYTWINDETPDLSSTLTKINHVSQSIFVSS